MNLRSEKLAPVVFRVSFPHPGMVTILIGILSMLIVTEFVLGNLANGFIALLNCIEWIKRHKLSSADQILTSLALSRLGLLGVIFMKWYTIVLTSASYRFEGLRIIILVSWTISNHFSIWFGTTLSIFYLLKIANFSSLMFFYLKRRVRNVLFIIQLWSLIFLISYLAAVSIQVNSLRNDSKGNLTWKLTCISYLSRMTIFTLESFIPFTMSLASFLLLIFSLGKHLRKMQLSGKGIRDPSTQVHLRALQTIVSFLLLFAVYFVVEIISIWDFNTQQNKPVLLLCKCFGMLYPSAHSWVLIWGNRKLKEDFLCFLWQLRNWL